MWKIGSDVLIIVVLIVLIVLIVLALLQCFSRGAVVFRLFFGSALVIVLQRFAAIWLTEIA